MQDCLNFKEEKKKEEKLNMGENVEEMKKEILRLQKMLDTQQSQHSQHSQQSQQSQHSQQSQQSQRSQQKHTISKDSDDKSNVCPICREEPNIPVTYNTIDSNGNLVACPVSKQSPYCLHCIRQYIGYEKHKCPTNCCEGGCNKKTIPNWKRYGDIGRRPDAVPCESLYRFMDNHNIGITVCRICNKDCGGVLNLAKHYKNKCPATKIECKRCKKKVRRDQLKEHNERCFHYCSLCGIDVKIKCNPDGSTDHNCPHVNLAKCRFCQKHITFSNVNEHKKCSNVKTRNLTVNSED